MAGVTGIATLINMSFEIDPHSLVPSYQQLADILRERIRSGAFRPREPIQSLAQLQEETGLAKGTIVDAIDVLAGEGLVYRVPGRGTFVSGTPRQSGG